ncbi:MAG: hypothetical protein HZB85_01835 [Deltaproteobacteria bacterium]|nr:hypothetical protein [Deltaproteobacteria bacterium]
MPKYIVKNTHIKHAAPGDEKAKTYGPGDEIELTKEEAAALVPNVEPKR